MPTLGLETEIVDTEVYRNSVERFREAQIVLPTFAQLADPRGLPERAVARLDAVDRDAPDPANLFRVHWHNGDGAVPLDSPEWIEFPSELTGVAARIVALPGDRFPMIHAHKVLAAYGCLVPRIVTGQYDPTRHKAVWPSTGNYCRGGVAISRILGCRGLAVLPEGMSRERFEWLERWVSEEEDIVRTPGTESNVKEIYDRCAELDREPENIIFNQFSEFGNYLVHYLCTGRALGTVFERLRAERPDSRLRGFVSATGSAGTLGAGDYVKERYGASLVAVEALECPTLLESGFGEHNIQGIGDKHVPLIHNVMNTDFVAGISDRATDGLDLVFNSQAGQDYLASRRNVPAATLDQLGRLGFSSICNLLASIKLARYLDLGEDDVVLTVATDGAELYGSEREKRVSERGGEIDEVAAAELVGEHLSGLGVDHLMELSEVDRRRIFNLGYFTWVEQQGISIEDFSARRRQRFWRQLRELIPAWDRGVTEFNRATGVELD